MIDEVGVLSCSGGRDPTGHVSGGRIGLGGMRRGFTGREGHKGPEDESTGKR